MLSAIERRNTFTSEQQKQQSEQFHAPGKGRNIRSLRDTCAVSVAGKLFKLLYIKAVIYVSYA